MNDTCLPPALERHVEGWGLAGESLKCSQGFCEPHRFCEPGPQIDAASRMLPQAWGWASCRGMSSGDRQALASCLPHAPPPSPRTQAGRQWAREEGETGGLPKTP